MSESQTSVICDYNEGRSDSKITIRLDQELKNAIEQTAVFADITTSELIRRAIEKETGCRSGAWFDLPQDISSRINREVDLGLFSDKNEAARYYIRLGVMFSTKGVVE